MSDLIFNIFYPMINTLMLLVNFPLFIDLKKHYKSYLFFFIAMDIATYISDQNFFLIIATIIVLVYFKLIKINFATVIISYIYILFATLISDCVCGIITQKIFYIPYEELKNNNTLYFYCGILILFLSFFICIVIRKITSLNKLTLNNILLNKFTKKIFMLAIALIITIVSIFKILTINILDGSSSNWIYMYLSLAITLCGILYMLFYITNSTISMSIKKDFITKENKQLKEYSDMLETMSTDLRKFKHDYINILYTLGDYINDGNIEDLRSYYNNDLLPESKEILKNDKHITLLKNIKITPLKALISSKLLTAQSKGIKINAEVLEEITYLSIKTIDICRIIGIFLDNAIEAALLCENKFINFAMIKTDGNIIIVILNSCLKNIPPVYELYKKNFSTKGSGRGIGLTSVKELIDSTYTNVLLNTSASNGVFKQELVIKNNNGI
ncbi:two-component system, AgrA family, sensor histidine kinase AgrC [Clostridium sp. DSM 8431]|nr:two-component system, AgrA family, sensor histidine kinase AgrC [Clostridium sp. DSM 8431]